jgi:Cu/Ag efflux protein CusF
MKKLLLVAATLLVAVTVITLVRADDMGNMPGMGMGGVGQTNNAIQNTNSDNSSVKSYPARGIVEKIAPDRHTATIHNETIPGYMDEMTMDFSVHNTNELNGISPGEKITFTVIVSTNDEWIENIKRAGHTKSAMTNDMPSMGSPNSGK